MVKETRFLDRHAIASHATKQETGFLRTSWAKGRDFLKETRFLTTRAIAPRATKQETGFLR